MADILEVETTPNSGKKILVVEDTEMTAKIIKRYLTSWGYDFTHASDGDLAWELLQREKFRMVLLDLIIPGMDGITICRELRERKDEDFIYIIMLTSKDRKEDIIAGLETGADDYVTKPFDPDVLHSRIKVGWRIVELERNLTEKVEELLESLSQVKHLQGLLPICCYCKKIRKDPDYWEQVEKYIAERSEAKFTHGICPECYAKYVEPEFEKLKKNENQD